LGVGVSFGSGGLQGRGDTSVRTAGRYLHGEAVLEQVLLTGTATCGEPVLEQICP